MLKKTSLPAARTAPILRDDGPRFLARLDGSMVLRSSWNRSHDQDEVYIIVSGTGSFVCAGERAV